MHVTFLYELVLQRHTCAPQEAEPPVMRIQNLMGNFLLHMIVQLRLGHQIARRPLSYIVVEKLILSSLAFFLVRRIGSARHNRPFNLSGDFINA